MYINKRKENHCTIISVLLDIFLNVSYSHTTLCTNNLHCLGIVKMIPAVCI